MASLTFSSKIGVSEASARSLNKAKTIVGTVDEHGDNIGIVNIRLLPFHKLPTIIMLVFLLPVLAGYFFQTPLSWLPVGPEHEWLWAAKNYQMFTFTGWLLTVASYLFLAFCVLLKNNYYSGVEGAYILFQRYGKIVKVLNPGNFWLNFDWRITPEYVVSSKKFMLTMPQVEGKERSNHTMYHTGAFIAQVASSEDAHQLISKGGFKNLIKAQEPIYTTSVKDLLKATTADSFNTFLVEKIKGARDLVDDSKALDEISKQNLSTELIEKLSLIENVDVSQIDLSEEGGVREVLLPMLRNVAVEYGVRLEDYVPLSNSVSQDFLGTKVIKLVTILERLKQASDNLYEITAEEWDEDIQSAVAGKKIGALEIKKIIDEMQALVNSMMEEENIKKIFEQKFGAIANIMEGHIGSILAKIESLQQKITSKSVDMTGLELYVSEFEQLIASLDTGDKIKALVPTINEVYVSNMSQESLLPSVNAVEVMLETTGLRTVFDKFKSGIGGTTESSQENTWKVTQELEELAKAAEEIEIESVLGELQKKLDKISGHAGIDIGRFKWSKVKERIAAIKENAGVEDDDTTDEEELGKELAEA
jgi:hypothetical protein